MRRARNGLAGALKTTVGAPASSKKPDEAALRNLWAAKPAFSCDFHTNEPGGANDNSGNRAL
jgi:hypothetical protein